MKRMLKNGVTTAGDLTCPTHLFIMAKNPCDLNCCLCRFVLEVRRKDGKECPPNTVHQLCCGIVRYVRDRVPELNIFKQPSFSGFQKALYAEMKRLRASGKGSAPKRAEPITRIEENSLWDQIILGDHSPRALVDTMVYMHVRSPLCTEERVRTPPVEEQ